MSIFDRFKKKDLPKLEVTKSGRNSSFYSAYYSSGENSDNRLLTIKKALDYYDIVAPVATAIDIINDEYKSLTIALERKGKVTLEHEILDFLKQPNDDMVQIDFLENMGNYFLTTNEVYFIATGRENRAPAELFIESPEFVEVKTDGTGAINRIEVTRKADEYKLAFRETFFRDDNDYRFFNRNRSAEIWQVKGFNTRKTLRGRSKLSALVYDIEQYLQASIHNLGLLSSGVRSTGAFTTEEPLTDEQFDRLRDQINMNHAGANNAGKSIILEGGMEYTEMSISPKDMDFAKLKQDTAEAIFKRYKIPLALVSTDHMAESTMEASMLMLYDIVVLPVAERLLAELTKFLAPRFGLSEDDKLVPFLDEISALQIRRVKEVKNKKETGVHTVDEIRASMGDVPLPDGKGKDLYIATNLVKIGETQQTSGQGQDGRQSRGDDDMRSDTPTDNERLKTTRAGYISILKQQVDLKGNRTFTDEEIYKLADEEGF